MMRSLLFHSLTILIRLQGHEVFPTTDPMEAIEYLKGHEVDILLTDIKMNELNGIELTEQALVLDPTIIPILMTAYADVDSTIDAMNKGAFKYIVKPYNNDDILETIKQGLERRDFLKTQIKTSSTEPYIYDKKLVGKSSAFIAIIQQLPAISTSQATVLILGESGVGKDLIARRIHDLSPRKNKPFIAVNCGALPENLLESELFGYARGAFTGAANNKIGLMVAAKGGTFFLDEISELPCLYRLSLLRAIQNKEIIPLGQTNAVSIDVRLIVATNKNLYKYVQEGRFREDLYYRLNVIPLIIPPLKERREDIPELVKFFLKRLDVEDMMGSITPQAWQKMLDYSWPGNVRELENLIERLVIVKHGQRIYPEDFVFETLYEAVHEPTLPYTPSKEGVVQVAKMHGNSSSRIEDFSGTLSELERLYIKSVLERCNGNRAKAAKMLGINPATLFRKLKGFQKP